MARTVQQVAAEFAAYNERQAAELLRVALEAVGTPAAECVDFEGIRRKIRAYGELAASMRACEQRARSSMNEHDRAQSAPG